MPKAKSKIPYYGGKSSLANLILPLIPEDIQSYIEPYAGGSSIYFLRDSVPLEVLNDKLDLVANFYIQIKLNYKKLKTIIDATPFSRRIHKISKSMIQFPLLHDKLSLAWAFYVNLVMSFSNILGGGFVSDKRGRKLKNFNQKKLSFDESIKTRLDNTIIESLDANECIKKYDDINALFFCDPPYVTDDFNLSINRGHYNSFTLGGDFKGLLTCLSKIKGRFLMTTYKSKMLEEFTEANGWYTKEYVRPITASHKKSGDKCRTKTEVFTANYPI